MKIIVAILTNLWAMIIIPITWTILSAIMSSATHDWSWFERSGSILTMIGAALTVRPLLRMGPEEFFKTLHTVDGGNLDPNMEEKEQDRQDKIDLTAYHVGFWFVFVGTLIWGYGSLIGKTY